MLRDSIGHPSKMLLSLKFAQSFYFKFRACRYIMELKIGHRSKKLLSFELSQSFCFQFAVSQYVTELNRTSE